MTLPEQIGRLSRTQQRVLSRRMASVSDLPFMHQRALRAIAKGEVVTQAELADRLVIDAPSASRLVDRLEEAGLLERKQGADRRCVKLAVTRKAARELAAINDAVEWLNGEVRRHLTRDEAETVTRLIEKLQRALDATTP